MSRTAFLALSITLISSVVSANSNLIPNSGFETGMAPWDWWTVGTVTVVTDGYTGQKSLQVTSSPSLGYGTANSAKVNVKPNTVYHLDGYAKRTAGSHSAPFMIAVQWLNAQHGTISVDNSWAGSVQHTEDGEPTIFEFHGGRFTSPPGAAMAVVTVGAWGTGTTYRFDDIGLRPYEIWYSPHFNHDPDNIFGSGQWENAKAKADVYKFVVVQFLSVPKLICPQRAFDDIGAAATELEAAGIAIALDVAGPFEKTSWFNDPDGIGVRSAEADLVVIDEIENAGGRVKYLAMDCPVSRLLKGARYGYPVEDPDKDAVSDPCSLTNPQPCDDGLAWWSDDVDEVAEQIRNYMQTIHSVYPNIQIGMITNFPNWTIDGLQNTAVPYTAGTGLPYEEVLAAVVNALGEDEPLAFLQADNPYTFAYGHPTDTNPITEADFHLGTRRLLALQKYCDEHEIPMSSILNTYIHSSCANPFAPGYDPCVACGTLTADSATFYTHTMNLMKTHALRGVTSFSYCVQSWYDYPLVQIPDTASNSFMKLGLFAADRAIKVRPLPLVNAGFETLNPAPPNGPANWTTLLGTVTSTTSTLIDGTNAVRVVANGANAAVRSDGVSIQAGLNYTLSYYAKRVAGTGSCRAYLVWFNSANTQLSSVYADGPVEAEYKWNGELNFQATAPTGATSVKVQFNVAGAGTECHFDHVTLMQTP